MSLSAKKREEGQHHVKKAEKALKTSFTKWSPDHDSAGDDYSKAATAFKVAKAYPEALDAMEKACDCYKNCRSLYQAAKMLEQSVLICRDSNQFDKIMNLAERGGLLYRQHGSPESAAQLLEKAAKILESKMPEQALTLYQKAAETILVEDRPKQAAEYLSKVGRLQVKAKLWSDAVETLQQTIKMMQQAGSTGTLGRLVVALVLVELVREDVVAASKAFRDWGGYCDPDQSGAVNTVLNGFNDEDGDMVRQGLNSPTVKNLDVEFARMAAKDVPVPEGDDADKLAAAAAAYGAQRLADASEKGEEPEAAAAEPLAGGEPLADDPEDVRREQKELELGGDGGGEEDDDDDLC